VEQAVARRMWMATEPVHALVYFAPEVRTAFDDAGLKGFWMGYFAGRAAPMGAVSAEVVTATFFNFHPAMVARAIPDAWQRASPEAVLVARLTGVAAAMAPLVDGVDLATAALLGRRAAEAVEIAGRPLAAANAALAWPDEPVLALWQATSVLREYRGDGHVAALVTEDVDGCEAHVLVAASGAVPADALRAARGWSEEDWAGAADRLVSRGLLDAAGGLTERGTQLRAHVERRTDELALAPWAALGDDGCHRLEAALEVVLTRIAASQTIPYPNPMGLPGPA
jgi:hypothetical protein